MKINKDTDFMAIREKITDDLDNREENTKLIYFFIYDHFQFNFRIFKGDCIKEIMIECIDLKNNRYCTDLVKKMLSNSKLIDIDNYSIANNICSLLQNSIQYISLSAFE